MKLVSVTFGDPELPKDGPKSDVPGTVLVDMPVTIAVEGPFLRITDLLRRVEVEMHRAVLIDNVALTEGDAGFPVLTGTCSGRAFALLTEGDPLLAAARKKSGTAGVPTPSPAPAPASPCP